MYSSTLARAACLTLLGTAPLFGCSSDESKGTLPDASPGATGGGSGSGGASSGGTSTTGGAQSSGGLASGGGPKSGGATASGGSGAGDSGATSSGGTGTGATDGGSIPDGGIFEMLGSPWGLAPSASSSRAFAAWMPKIAESGAGWVRGFDGSKTAETMTVAAANGLEVSGILQWGDGTGPLAFPIANIPGWKTYVTNAVTAGKGKIHYWEVWNEPPNFTEIKTPEAYAQIVQAAYDAAKAVDPDVHVGLAAQSVNLNFLAQALAAGAAGHFDYVTVHPYETLGLVQGGWEAEYLGIVPTIRKMLADKSPAQKNVPVIFTELGEPVSGDVTEAHQADTLVKAFVLGLAQGVARVHWFEPLDGDSGPFGVLHNDLSERPSYVALKSMITNLGDVPSYQGYILPGGDCCGFVFRNGDTLSLVAWSQKTPTLSLGDGARVIQPQTGASTNATTVKLSSSPIIAVIAIVDAYGPNLLAEARTHAAEPFPWNGTYTTATSVSFTAPADASGLHPLGEGKTITLGGEQARDISGGPGISFTVDPHFVSYTPARLRITAVVRRNGADSAGFNLKYEATSGWKGGPAWFTVPAGDTWTTQTYTIDDPQFVGKWGFNFSFDSDSTQYSKYSIRSVTVTKE